MSVSRSHNQKKRSMSRPKKTKKRIGVKLMHGRSMEAIKRSGNREKFGKKKS